MQCERSIFSEITRVSYATFPHYTYHVNTTLDTDLGYIEYVPRMIALSILRQYCDHFVTFHNLI